MSLFIDDYALGARIGEGATGIVYRARYGGRGGVVALKVLHRGVVDGVDAHAAFHADARKLFALDHPQIGRLLDFGYDAKRQQYFTVTELQPGPTLADELRRVGRFCEAEARELVATIADGLAAAHASGVVHRGLTASNVMLGAPHGPRIIDFRVAAVPGWPTRPAVYVAPEAAAWQAIGPAGDVWAIGVLLVELVTGTLPDLRSPLAASCSDALLRLIRTCLARDPNRRPWSMTSIAATLRAGAPVQAWWC